MRGSPGRGPVRIASAWVLTRELAARVTAPGHQAAEIEVTDKPVTVKLVPFPRVLHVTSQPAGAANCRAQVVQPGLSTQTILGFAWYR